MSLYTVANLRNEIGGPTADTAEYGYVSDSMLQGIIDRYTDEYNDAIEVRIADLMTKNLPLLDEQDLTQVSLPLTTPVDVGLSSNYKECVISSTYYPYTLTPGYDSDGFVYTNDPNIESTVSLSFITRRRFKIVGSKVVVIPNDITSIVLFLPDKTKVNNRVGAEIEVAFNQMILKDAIVMMDRRVQEGSRLEIQDKDIE